MNKSKMIKSGILGLAGLFATQAQADVASENANVLNLLRTSKTQVSVDALAGNTCYGKPCPSLVDNCDDAVITSNLATLQDLNIVDVGALSPFSCTGYCISNTPKGRQADKCAKAESLAKLVKLAAPLAVAPGY
jgi:hypothetical protein